MREIREILFRGKRVDNGEWVYGFYVVLKLVHYDKKEHLITDKDTGRSYEIDPATIGQYTGLKDKKNGKRIFEGDILEVNYGKIYVGAKGRVRFDAGVYMLEGISGVLSLCAYAPYCEVIGNIHDNPELLKDGADG